MKKIIRIYLILTLIVILTACNNSTPPNPTDEFQYKAIPDGIEITRYIGASVKVNVPDKIEGIQVTSIGRATFEETGIMEVHFPSSVVSIGENALFNNPGLVKVLYQSVIYEFKLSGIWSDDVDELMRVEMPEKLIQAILGQNTWFNPPYEEISIPRFEGRRYEDLANDIDYARLYNFIPTFISHDTVAEGVVITQTPEAATMRNAPMEGSRITIRLDVSSGREP